MRGIVKEFPGVRALDGVDLDVAAGEVHCLLGQNGAGKSTLIKVLAGAHRPDAGEISLGGQPGRRSARRRPPTRPASPPSTRSWTWCPGCRWRRTSCSATSRPGSGSAGRAPPRTRARALLRRLGHPEIPPRRELGRLSAAGPAGGQHGPGAGPRRAADRDGRAVGGARPGGGRQPVPGDPRADRRRRRGRLHLAPAGGDPPDRRPGHRAQGRPHRRPQPARPARPRPPRSSG